MVSWPISGMFREAALTIATVAESRTLRIRAAMQPGLRTAGMGSRTSFLPRILPIPEARTQIAQGAGLIRPEPDEPCFLIAFIPDV
jgi:hypothetical protein